MIEPATLNSFPGWNSVPDPLLSVGNGTQWGQGGNIKEGLKLTPMSSFDIEQGGINSRPDSCRVPEWVRTDGTGFSLCAAPLELSGPGFHGVGQRLGERAEVQRCTRPETLERVESKGRSCFGTLEKTVV